MLTNEEIETKLKTRVSNAIEFTPTMGKRSCRKSQGVHTKLCFCFKL